jgi:hypothetical protein
MRELITAESKLICDVMAAAYRHSETILGEDILTCGGEGFY